MPQEPGPLKLHRWWASPTSNSNSNSSDPSLPSPSGRPLSDFLSIFQVTEKNDRRLYIEAHVVAQAPQKLSDWPLPLEHSLGSETAADHLIEALLSENRKLKAKEEGVKAALALLELRKGSGSH